MLMRVLVAQKCGFCHGVRNAITIAEKILAQEREVYSLGPIIHNADVVRRLAEAGLKTVDNVEDIPSRPKGGNSKFPCVLIRSHGAAPGQIAKLKQRGLKIVDATCGLVKRLQRIAK